MDDEKLISLVQNKPILYNKFQASYRLPEAKRKAWDEIGAEMHCSGEQCRKRWTTLREHFNREKKKLGSGAADNQLWALYEAMLFLSPYVMPRPVHCSTNALLCKKHYLNEGTLSQLPTLTPVPILTPFPRRISSSPALSTQTEHHFVGTRPPKSSIPKYNQYVIEEQPSYRQTCQSFSTDSPSPSPSPSASSSSSNRKRHAAALETEIRETLADYRKKQRSDNPAHAAIRACGDMIVHTIIGLECPILQARAIKSMTDLAMSFQIQNQESKSKPNKMERNGNAASPTKKKGNCPAPQRCVKR